MNRYCPGPPVRINQTKVPSGKFILAWKHRVVSEYKAKGVLISARASAVRDDVHVGTVEVSSRKVQAVHEAVHADELGVMERPDDFALVVFSGGTAFNSVAGYLKELTSRVAYLLPVSDDGGSTAEIVRVLGGPAVGDIRSRCLRLADDSDEEGCAVRDLLAHRLSSRDHKSAKNEWHSMIEGDHELWKGVSEPYKHVIRAYLVCFHASILRHSSEQFNFKNGSIGNFFFAGARIFFRSLDAAIFLFSRVARLPLGSVVLPAISTEGRITLGAELQNGEVLRGHNQISHPPRVPSSPQQPTTTTDSNDDEDGPSLCDKSCDFQPLPSAIRRVFYLSSEGTGSEHEVFPKANPRSLHEIEHADAIIYGMGSLYTSICPSLCLNGMGEAIAARGVPKIMCLNGSYDRETAIAATHEGPMTALDMVKAVTDSLNRKGSRWGVTLTHPPNAFITGLLLVRGTFTVDRVALAGLGIHHVMEVDPAPGECGFMYEPKAFISELKAMLSQLACGASTGGGDAESRLSLLARGVGTGGVVAESRLSQLARGAGTGGVVAESRLSQLARGAGTGGGGVESVDAGGGYSSRSSGSSSSSSSSRIDVKAFNSSLTTSAPNSHRNSSSPGSSSQAQAADPLPTPSSSSIHTQAHGALDSAPNHDPLPTPPTSGRQAQAQDALDSAPNHNSLPTPSTSSLHTQAHDALDSAPNHNPLPTPSTSGRSLPPYHSPSLPPSLDPLIHLFGGRPLSPPTPSFRGLQGGLGGAPPFGEGGHGEPSLVVFSGGTAFNMVASELRGLTSKVAYVLPVSDDGGSTAEIVRVLGGPAVGDIRSRCLRLADDSDEEACAVKHLLAHRLSADDCEQAKAEWRSIVEGDHKLWRGVSEPYKHVIRAFLVHFEKELLQLMVQASVQFDFRNGSVGNFFFAGARIFFRSLDAAIFLFSRVARLPLGSVVLPAISTEGRITLGAELENGVCIRGQNQISHPPHVASTLVDKSCDFQPLPSAIRRVFYLSSEGSGQEHEVFPKANPRAMSEIDSSDAIIYGMGSLYTSICPTLCLDGTGEHVADRDVPKILCINGSHDRETSSSGAHDGPMLASDMVQAVTDALNRRRTRFGSRLWRPPSAYVTGLLVPKGGDIEVDIPKLKQLGVQYVSEVESFLDVASGSIYFQPAGLVAGIEGMIKLQSQAPVGQEYSI